MEVPGHFLPVNLYINIGNIRCYLRREHVLLSRRLSGVFAIQAKRKLLIITFAIW